MVHWNEIQDNSWENLDIWVVNFFLECFYFQKTSEQQLLAVREIVILLLTDSAGYCLRWFDALQCFQHLLAFVLPCSTSFSSNIMGYQTLPHQIWNSFHCRKSLFPRNLSSCFKNKWKEERFWNMCLMLFFYYVFTTEHQLILLLELILNFKLLGMSSSQCCCVRW